MSRYAHAHPYRTVQTFEVRIGAVVLRVDAWEWRSAATAARKRYADLTGRAGPLVRRDDVTKLRIGERA